MSDSFVRRFLFEHLDIRGAVVHLGDSWQQMQAGRDYQPTVAQLLGETAAVTALIAAVAELTRRTVLHLDEDFDLIADLTGQAAERLCVE